MVKIVFWSVGLPILLVGSFLSYLVQAETLAEQLSRQREVNASQQEYIEQLKSAHVRDRIAIQEAELRNLRGNAKALIGLLVSLNGIAGAVGLYIIRSMSRLHKGVSMMKKVDERLTGLELAFSALACQRLAPAFTSAQDPPDCSASTTAGTP